MSRSLLLSLSFLSFTVLADAVANADQGQAALLAKVDDLFASCNRPDLPGCAVGIVQDGNLIYKKGFGTANLDYGTPNDTQTIFEIASASKAFTSACIAILMDEGTLSPDDEIRRWIPELSGLEHPVRIRHMLRCESGLWEQFHIMPLAGWENTPNHVGYTKADLFTLLTGQKRLPFEPGTEFHYGSGEFFLLGIVIERITGKTLPQFARERLFEPLGMTRTYYEEDPGLAVKNRAVGHWKSDEGWSSQGRTGASPWRLWQVNAYAAGPGGLRTCVEDLWKLNQALDKPDMLPSGKYFTEFLTEGTVLGNRFVVDADAYKKRTQPHPDNEPMGRYRGLRRIQFTGGFWGMSTCISRFPDQKLTVICLSNSSEVSPFAKSREIAELFLADKLAPIVTSKQDEEFIKLSPDQLQQLTGAFRDRGNSPVWRTQVRNGDLILVDHLEKEFVLKPLSETRFKPVAPSPFYVSARFEFVTNDDGGRRLRLSSFENGFHEVINFDPVNLVEVSNERLKDYAGTYVSEELAATYRFKVEDNSLWLRVNSRRWEKLRPLVQDEFTPDRRDPHDQRFIRFTRNKQGAIDGFSVGFWRIRGVTFARSPD